MTPVRYVAAIDLGAESGRVAKVGFDGTGFSLDVAHRFSHTPRVEDGVARWNLDSLSAEVRTGLDVLAAGDDIIASVGTDTWGVDYGLLGADGELIDAPTCYRDERQLRSFDRVTQDMDVASIYDATGTQVLGINTLFALADDAASPLQRLARAERLVMLPDVFHHVLSGSTVTEYTAASTSGCYDMARGRWAVELLEQLHIPTRILPEVVQPGTELGALAPDFAGGRLSGARVITPAGHDTASAVIATPMASPEGLYISSGTWSLVGVETRAPIISAQARLANVTNEGGYRGTIRFLRNIAGLWLIQSCRRAWACQGTRYSYADLVELAEAAGPAVSIVNPDAVEFLDGREAPARVQDYCARTGQQVPQTVGEVARCVFASLALGYRHVVADLREITGYAIGTVNIVGGGSSNTLLSQLTADAIDVPVTCGPVEATALGNGAVQLATLGELDGIEQIREAIRQSTESTSYFPAPQGRWDDLYERFVRLVEDDRQRSEVRT